MGSATRVIRFDEFDLDEANALLTRAGRPVQLPPKAFAVLCELTRQPLQLTKKDTLLDAVWGHRHVSESVLKTTISQVRAALADDPARPRYIETVSRHGYRFVAAVVVPSVALEPSQRCASNALEPLIGRAAELATLHAAWGRVRGGMRRLIWIAGEAGVGKSTLIRRFLGEIAPASTAVGHCVEHFGTGEPCLHLLEALRELCTLKPELPGLMRAVAPTWIVQMPWLLSETDRAALHRDLSGVHPDRMVRELLELLHRLSASQPAVLVTEDLHWSDPATLRMMEHFAR
jgi:DNA-binding winged helix-turn-helix (wHTH) protein